jgi:D-beta-D-heptose 7-phosphate kinase/D-beta-D-heptose 1-phosphate adenosyltransferase
MSKRKPSTGAPSVVVYGDVILDIYHYVKRVKKNVETDCGSVYLVDRTESRLGGAGAAAMLAAGLGADVRLYGPLGNDLAADTVRTLCKRSNVDGSGLVGAGKRRTPVKHRHVDTDGDTLLQHRFDLEDCTPYAAPGIPFSGDVLVISDYGKGACGNVQKLIRDTTSKHIIVDPAYMKDWHIYRGATIIKPNYREACDAAKRLGYDCVLEHPGAVASFLAIALGTTIVLTKDSEGFFISHPNGDFLHVPAASADKKDVTGAGDTVAAALAVSISRQDSVYEACRFAAKLAAKQIESIGVIQVSAE